MPIDARDHTGRWRQFNLGARRVQQLKGSMIVTLPAHWCRSKGVMKGDPVEMYLLPDGDLLIKSVDNRPPKGG